MAHVREQIEAALATALTGLTTTGTNVFREPAHMIAAADLPALVIESTEEAIEYETKGADPKLRRELSIDVRVMVRQATGLATVINSICLEVEAAIDADETLGGVCQLCRMVSFVRAQDEDSEQPTMEGMITFRAVYVTTRSNPQASL